MTEFLSQFEMNAEMDISKNQWRSTGGKSVRKTCVDGLCKVWNMNWGPMNIITQMRPLLNTTDPYAMTYIQPQKVNKKTKQK